MSSPLAIAAVTALLKDLLNEGLINRNLGSVGNFSVSSKPLDRVLGDGPEVNQLNIFLYHVSPNTGWRNADLPSRNDRGERISNPPLALDLHYLLTAYGAADFNAEILLGYAMHLLHELPVLPRQTIRDALAFPGSPVSSTDLLPPSPSRFANLPAADLAEQVEQLKITPQYLNTEEMSKLWTSFQTRYRPTAAYVVSVVLIQSTGPVRSPLPVLTRGRFDPLLRRDTGVGVEPDLLPPFPTLLAAEPPRAQVAVRLGETLVLRGHHLFSPGDTVVARFTQPRTSHALELEAAAGAGATAFQVTIPLDPALGSANPNGPLNPDSWQAGIYSVAAIVRRAGEPDHVSNELAVALAPAISQPIGMSGAASEAILTVQCRPKARLTQRVTLMVGVQELSGELVLASPTDTQTDTIVFKSHGLTSGSYPVRLRVDGVESVLVDRSLAPPTFIASQQVTLP